MNRLVFPIVTFVFSFIIGIPDSSFSAISQFSPMNGTDHPVSTTNPQVQESFNTGLSYIFAFNHDLAFKEFEKASQLDPNLAMAYWGMALALGQNINQDVTPENEKRAYGYSQKALTLLSGATPVEQQYITALAQRYTDDPSQDLVALRFLYRDAMKKLAANYPEDLDAACLYAESILDLDPWKYWTWDGKPEKGTSEVIDILQSVLRRNPDHIGGNHYYVHAWEESPTPEEALVSAFRLTTLLPQAGHLLHMPCHIFILCGYYGDAIKTNKRAIAADLQYIKEYGMGGEYPLHYLSHNYKILARAYMFSEEYENAIRTSEELNQFLDPYYQQMPPLATYMIVPMEINLYFHRWDELLALKPPSIDHAFTQSYWHFSRAMAYVHLGDMDGYRKEKSLMLEAKQTILPDEQFANNSAIQVLELGELLLDAALARSQKKTAVYIDNLQRAVDKQDRFHYDEPPAWYTPIRIQLGYALLEEKRYKEAEEVFNKALTQLQRNGRLLFGLHLSLKAQGRVWDAYWVEREAKAALRNGTQPPFQLSNP